METLLIVLNVIIILGIIAGGLLLKGYLPGYAREKGKNLATREDIEVITEKVESVRSQYASSLESIKADLQVESALKSAFQQKCFEAVSEINQLLVDITLYCWKEMAERSPNEHYVWSAVDESDSKNGFHYYRVAIDKARLVHGMFLTNSAKEHLADLADQIGLLSSMELALMDSDPIPEIVESAEQGYRSGLKAVEECRQALMAELGLTQ